MATVFRNQVIAGHSVGASRLFGALLMLIAVSLVLVNSYHMGNFLDSKLTTAESLFIWSVMLYAAGTGIAALEIPLGKSLVTSYRLDGLSFGVFMQALFACVIACMAVFAGVNSQLADADRRDTQTASYSVGASSFANMKRSAAITRDAAIARASLIHNSESRQIAILDAKAAYQNRLVDIAQQEASHTLKKPVQMLESGSDEQYITIMLFSIACSFGALFVSMFHAVYINPLVAMPAFSLKAKKAHDWNSDGSNFQAANHELSPLANKFNGFLQREKVPAKALPSTSESDNLTSGSSGDTENRPEQAPTMAGAVSNASNDASDRILNADTQKGDKVEYSQSHYDAIKQGVLSGEIKPTQKPVRDELVSLNVRFVDDAERARKASEILDTLKGEGVLIDNPEFGKSKKIVAKYVVNPDYSKQGRGQHVEPDYSSDEIGEHDLVTVCPHCQTVNTTHVLKIDKRKGTVKCIQCSKGHVATTHQYTSEQSYSDMLASAKNT